MNNLKSVRKFNAGIAILKIAACFGVVSMHFGSFGFFRKAAVPTFVLVSFYLSARLFERIDLRDLGRRMRRLAIPFFAWGIISLLCWWVCGSEVTGKIVLMQLTCGRADVVSAGHLYYLEVCAIMTLILYALPRRRFDLWLVAVIVFSFCLQYSNLNYQIFHPMGYNAMNTFGRICEFITYAATGLLLAHTMKWFRSVYDFKWFWFICAVGFGLSGVLYAGKLIPTPQGFASQGIAAFLMTVTFDLPFVVLGEYLQSKVALQSGMPMRALQYASSLTGGMYYVHVLVGTVLVVLSGIEHSGLYDSGVLRQCCGDDYFGQGEIFELVG